MKRLLVVFLAASIWMYVQAQGVFKPVSPKIVEKLSLINQTGSIPQTNIFTPTIDGDYKLIVYIDSEAYPAGYSGPLAFVVFGWTDDFSPLPWNSATGAATDVQISPSTIANHNILETPLRLKAGEPIFVFQNSSGPFPTYNIYITLESLQ